MLCCQLRLGVADDTSRRVDDAFDGDVADLFTLSEGNKIASILLIQANTQKIAQTNQCVTHPLANNVVLEGVLLHHRITANTSLLAFLALKNH